MDIINLAFMLLLSILIGSIFVYLFKIRGPWGRGWAFILILFLGIWAVAVWITPVGPSIYNVHWVPLLLTGIVLALLLAAATPHSGGRTIVRSRSALSIFFWIFLISLITVIILGLMLNPMSDVENFNDLMNRLR